MQIPDVKTVLKESNINFRFEVLAFRRLSQKELESLLVAWMKSERRKTLPHDKTIQMLTRIGLDG